MKTIHLVNIARTYSNNGQHAQQVLDFNLTGQLRKHDHVKWNEGSDIPECLMSVKSSKATLVGGGQCSSIDYTEIIEEYFLKVASVQFAYVTADFQTAYIMNAVEFREFVTQFTYLTRESSKNGGAVKVRFRQESSKMLYWLNTH